MFVTPFPNAFALNIGDLSIKAVQLRNTSHRHRTPSYSILTTRATSLPAGLIVNGILEQPEQVRKYIIHLLQGNRKQSAIKSPWVVASIPDTQGFIKLIHIDKKEDDIIEEDIVYAAKKHIPFDENEYYIDWQIMPEHTLDAEKTDILIGAVPKNVANMYTYLLESVGLNVVALEIEALATARAMITANKTYENEARAILDLGATRSTIIIYDHGHIQFSSSLPFSGEIVTTAISQRLHITHDEAEKKKINDGLEYQKSDIWPIVTEITDQLITDIQKAIQFYYSHFPSPNKITHITMCGSGSAMKRLDKILSLKLKIVARPGQVWKNLFLQKPGPDATESLSYATAIGLALRAADNPFFMDNII